MGLISSSKPQQTAYEIHEYLCSLKNHYWDEFETIIDPTADVHPSAIIPKKNVTIGSHTKIEPGCIIMERTLIGNDCNIGPAVVIGGDAFEIAQFNGTPRVLKQGGGVKIGNNVTIQACSHIARATFTGFTQIDDNSAIDAQVHIAHDCNIKRNVKITACSEVSGRVTIEDGAYLGPNCTISNGLRTVSYTHLTLPTTPYV